MKLRNRTLIIIAWLTLLSGCGDPGYHLRPIGWESTRDHVWKRKFADFEIATKGIEGLRGEWWVNPELQIFRNTKSISVESAELRTATERFTGEIYDSSPIPPSADGYHIPVRWEFEQKRAAPIVLGDHCEIVLNLKVGGEIRRIKIEYE
jgi:hypothetical protein